MGQYWKPVCLKINPKTIGSKKGIEVISGEYLEPHYFNQGLKWIEFTSSSKGVLKAVAILLTSNDSVGHGGGGFQSRWRDFCETRFWSGSKVGFVWGLLISSPGNFVRFGFSAKGSVVTVWKNDNRLGCLICTWRHFSQNKDGLLYLEQVPIKKGMWG